MILTYLSRQEFNTSVSLQPPEEARYSHILYKDFAVMPPDGSMPGCWLQMN